MPGKGPYAECACFNVRKVARLLAQVYDRALEPAGLKNTQFTLLAVASRSGPISITELSRELDLERTTLTRNLRIMERDGLVAVGPGNDARSKTVTVTREGKSRLQKATPLWRATQARVLKRFGQNRWSALRGELEEMLRSARAAA
jgi:DNA-binding MarR family transcriptional regulator